MKRKVASWVFALAAALVSGGASAYTVFGGGGTDPGNGEDLNPNDGAAPMKADQTVNSSAAAAEFLGTLTGVRTETFESQTPGTAAPLNLSFQGSSGTSLTATLSGGSGQVASTPAVDGASYKGRYSVPSENSSNFWEVAANETGDFTITFGTAIGAFGFYGIDIGDAGGTVSLEFYSGTTLIGTQSLNNSTGSDGSVIFFGVLAESLDELFTSVRFVLSPGTTETLDQFAFDNFTIGDACQYSNGFSGNCGSTGGGGGGGGGDVPEPGSLALAGLALAGLGWSRRRRV